MTEGTKSYLIGCHNFFIHPLFVLIAWYKIYKCFPKFWELICILIHDIGHIGRQYLSDPREKSKHWKLGANIAYKYFGKKGFYFIAGHSTGSGYPKSKMYVPDKICWLYYPNWILWINYYVEDFRSKSTKPDVWKKLVKENMLNNFKKGNHEIYLENRKSF